MNNTPHLNQHWMQRDLAALWHPCTQMKDHEHWPIIPIKRGEGVFLEDFEGRRYIDGISSWWVNLFGHCHPQINAALKEQLDQLEHVLLAGFSHAPAIELSERLIALAPPGLARVFYADNGSSGIEVALKMSFHYWQNQDKPQKTKFVNLANSYHGETLAALSVGDVALYKNSYKPLLMQAITAPSPDCYHCPPGMSWHDYSLQQFQAMEQILEQQHQQIAAVIIEPLVQCAGSMRMYHPVYLSALRQACDRYQVHLIADEIAVGFGRTGTLFACEQAQITPDFLCLSKGLTGGYLPLCTVLTTGAVYDAFYHNYDQLKAFLHSHSYTGNPLACRAALATLDLFAQRDVIADNRNLAQCLAQALAPLQQHPNVAEVRQAGMIVAIELVADKASKTPFPWQQRRGLTLYHYALSQGCLLRPLGSVIYLMPPYIITPPQIEYLAEVIRRGIDLAVSDDGIYG